MSVTASVVSVDPRDFGVPYGQFAEAFIRWLQNGMSIESRPLLHLHYEPSSRRMNVTKVPTP
jgi:hypothetical protein